MSLPIKIKKLNPDAIVPRYAHEGDAGLDLFSTQTIIIHPGERVQIPTGVAIELPPGYVALIWDKSGLSSLHGLKIMAGVIEHTYRGEYMACMINLGPKDYTIEKGHKVAQLLIQKIETAVVEVVDELSESVRGTNNFGSSGK
jgi:dUTP pyrophosphatase